MTPFFTHVSTSEDLFSSLHPLALVVVVAGATKGTVVGPAGFLTFIVFAMR